MVIQQLAKRRKFSGSDLWVHSQSLNQTGHLPVLVQQLRHQDFSFPARTASGRKHDLFLDPEVLPQMSLEKCGQRCSLLHGLARPVLIRCLRTAHQALRKDQALVVIACDGNQGGMSFGDELSSQVKSVVRITWRPTVGRSSMPVTPRLQEVSYGDVIQPAGLAGSSRLVLAGQVLAENGTPPA